jgi:DNA repair photolyase
METILAEARDAGASAAAYMLLRLPLEIRELFFEWLHQHYPLRAAHVISLLRQSRGGADYDSRFGHRMRGTGTFADLLVQRFRVACKRLGLTQGEGQYGSRTDLFTPPARSTRSAVKPQTGQIELF